MTILEIVEIVFAALLGALTKHAHQCMFQLGLLTRRAGYAVLRLRR